jgi:hypothetical protein
LYRERASVAEHLKLAHDAFTPEQALALRRDGFVVLPGIVPLVQVRMMQRLIHRNIGRQVNALQALGRPPSERDLSRAERANTAAAAAQFDPAILALMFDTPLAGILARAMGAPMLPIRGAQLATLFPAAPNNLVNESGYRDRDTPHYGWHGHLDGLWNGATPMHQDIDTPMSEEAFAAWNADIGVNGVPKVHPGTGANIANFTALVGVALSDQREEGVGNLAVLKGAHLHMAEFFRMQRAAGGPLGPDGPEWPRLDHTAANGCGLRHYPDSVRSAFMQEGVLAANGRLWPKPTQVRMAPGDAVVALHALPHDSTRVEGHEPRLMAYFRVTRSGRPEGQEMVYPDALCDPFIEWTGLRSAMH